MLADLSGAGASLEAAGLLGGHWAASYPSTGIPRLSPEGCVFCPASELGVGDPALSRLSSSLGRLPTTQEAKVGVSAMSPPKDMGFPDRCLHWLRAGMTREMGLGWGSSRPSLGKKLQACGLR